jgi:hypothetical protein
VGRQTQWYLLHRVPNCWSEAQPQQSHQQVHSPALVLQSASYWHSRVLEQQHTCCVVDVGTKPAQPCWLQVHLLVVLRKYDAKSCALA